MVVFFSFHREITAQSKRKRVTTNFDDKRDLTINIFIGENLTIDRDIIDY